MENKNEIIVYIEHSVCSLLGISRQKSNYQNQIYIDKLIHKIIKWSEYSFTDYFERQKRHDIDKKFSLLHETMLLFKHEIPKKDFLKVYANIFNEAPTILPSQVSVIEKELDLISSPLFQKIILEKLQITTNSEPYYLHYNYKKLPDIEKNIVDNFILSHYSRILKNDTPTSAELLLRHLNSIMNIYEIRGKCVADNSTIVDIIDKNAQTLQFNLFEDKNEHYNYHRFTNSVFKNNFFSETQKKMIYKKLNICESTFYKQSSLLKSSLLSFETNTVPQIKKLLSSVHFTQHYSPKKFFKDFIMQTESFTPVNILLTFMDLYTKHYDKAHAITQFFLPHLKSTISPKEKLNEAEELDYLIRHIHKKKDSRIIEALTRFQAVQARYEKESLEQTLNCSVPDTNKFKI